MVDRVWRGTASGANEHGDVIEAGHGPPPAAAPEPADGPRFRSRFGGLWTDRSDAGAVLDAKLERAEIDATEHAHLRSFIDDGYVIFRSAVPHHQVEALRAEIDTLFAGPSTEVWVEAKSGRLIEHLEPRHRDLRCKVLDLHAHLPSAGEVAFTETLDRFLHLLFDRAPLAFQSLYFERGIGQPLHRDTAFVRCSSPLEFAAAWIALEPIVAGSGELELYPGSHALPEKLFRGGSKHAPAVPAGYTSQLRRQCKKAGLHNERFIAQPGDVLVWAADLAHGGSKVRNKDLTRRSLVVHYCPLDVEPTYGGPPAPRVRHGEDAYSTYVTR